MQVVFNTIPVILVFKLSNMAKLKLILTILILRTLIIFSQDESTATSSSLFPLYGVKRIFHSFSTLSYVNY